MKNNDYFCGMDIEKKPAGRKKLPTGEKGKQIQNTFLVKEKYFSSIDWVKYIRECIKKKENEIAG